MNCNEVVLLNDKTKPQVRKITRNTIIRCGLETLMHAPYFQDIAHNHLFDSMKNYRRGPQLRTLDDMKIAPDEFFPF